MTAPKLQPPDHFGMQLVTRCKDFDADAVRCAHATLPGGTEAHCKHWHGKCRSATWWKRQINISEANHPNVLAPGTQLASRTASQEAQEVRMKELLARAHHWRTVAGQLHCDVFGVGPTGGFCATKNTNDPNLCTSVPLAEELGRLFVNRSVLDLGCGQGGYGRQFREKVPSVHWLGLDGAEGVEAATDGLVRWADLTEDLPAFVQRPWDWVLSLEVAEHLPRPDEPRFMHNLVSHAR